MCIIWFNHEETLITWSTLKVRGQIFYRYYIHVEYKLKNSLYTKANHRLTWMMGCKFCMLYLYWLAEALWNLNNLCNITSVLYTQYVDYVFTVFECMYKNLDVLMKTMHLIVRNMESNNETDDLSSHISNNKK